MRHYKRKIDSAFGVALIYALLLGLLLLVMAFHAAVLWQQPQFAPLIFPFALMIAVVIFIRKRLLQTSVAWWGHAALAVSVILAFATFYRMPMHDLAMTYFDSHGRFGCAALEEVSPGEYHHAYIFHDEVIPRTLFLPLLGAVFLHWLSCFPRERWSVWRRWLTTYGSKRTAAQPCVAANPAIA